MGWTFYNSSGQQMRATADKTATQAEMEAASSTTAYVSPGRTQFHPGVAKAWVYWEQTGAHGIIADYNYTGDGSVTDGSGAGDTDHLFHIAMSGTDYVIAAANQSSRFISISPSNTTANGFTSLSYDDAGTLTDGNSNRLVVFGDQ
jgi:hypothetical protein